MANRLARYAGDQQQHAVNLKLREEMQHETGGTDLEIRLPEIHSEVELIALVQEVGFLPFFQNEISCFSIEDCTPPDLWFSDTQDGPWEWNSPAARSKSCIYGKLFLRKAGFVSREWMPHFCNLRRKGYDFDVLFDEQGASYQDKRLYDTLCEHRAMETGHLKSILNYRKGAIRV